MFEQDKNNADDIFLDFKPLTGGLGFQKPTKLEVKEIQPIEKKIIRTEAETHHYFASDIERFYQKAKEKTVQKQMPKEKVWVDAAWDLRVKAFLVDVSLVLALVGIGMTWTGLLGRLDWATAFKTIPMEATALMFCFFAMAFLFYFSVWEKTTSSTLGKSFFGLKVLDEANHTASLNALFTRSVLSLASIFSLGLFAYFNLPQKVSKTSVKILKSF